MIEEQLILASINAGGCGIFAYLMYRMTNTTIKENTKAIQDLRDVILQSTIKPRK